MIEFQAPSPGRAILRTLLLMLISVPAVALAQTGLEVNQTFALLGSFAAEDPSSSIYNPGTTQIRLISPVPWSLMVTLAQPVRRVSDNLELPTERARQLFGDLPPSFFDLQPVRLDYGQGDTAWQALDYDWQLFQMRLDQYLELGDPPGIYQTALNFELQDREGNPLDDGITVVVEFEVLPQIQIEVIEPVPELLVDTPGEPAESEPILLLLRANTGWQLGVQCAGNLMEVEGDAEVDLSQLHWRVPPEAEWESLIPDYIPVTTDAVIIAQGDAPAPFTYYETAVPLQLRLETTRTTIATLYGCDVEFLATTELPAR